MTKCLKIFTLLFLLTTSTIFAKVYKEPFPLSVLPYPEEITNEISLPQPDSLNIKINNDFTTQVQNEEQIALNLKNPNNYVAVWRDFRLGYRQIGIEKLILQGFRTLPT
jgi:hypothetical protein